MKKNSLFYTLQNPAVGAIAIQSFILGYFNIAKHKDEIDSFPRLQYLFYVLPIVYNESSAETIRTSTQLYTALRNNKEIVLGLQERSYKMASQTFDAINIGFSKQIMTFNKTLNTVELCKGFQTKKLPLTSTMISPENTVKRIQDSAHRLGAIFAKKNDTALQTELNIRF